MISFKNLTTTLLWFILLWIASTHLDTQSTATKMCWFPNKLGKGPLKSMLQTSKSSIFRIRLRGIKLRFEILPTIWYLGHVLQNLKASLNKMGQYNPLCNIFSVVVRRAKCLPHASSWQKERTLLTCSSGIHFLMFWSEQYLKRYVFSQKNIGLEIGTGWHLI